MQASTPTPLTKRTPAVCLGCTLCCDDVALSLTNRELQFSEQFCEQGAEWFRRQAAAEQATSAVGMQIAGRVATRSAAIRAAAELIRDSRSPLIVGLGWRSLAEQQALMNLALQTRALIDVDWRQPEAGNLAAFQHTGRVTATLGQVAVQASLHLLIEAAPERTHPRLYERLGWDQQSGWRFRTRTLEVGRELAAGTPARAEVICDDALALNDLIWWLRAFARGLEDPGRQCPPQWQQSLEQFLADVRTARGVAVIGGSELGKHPELTLQVHQLVRELNELCKTWLLLTAADGNTAGAESVLTWSAGFPRSIDLRSGHAEWNRTEFSAAELLARQEPDLVLCCLAADDASAWEKLTSEVRARLLKLPRIVFYSGEHPLVTGAEVAIPIAQFGWDSSGDVVRMDELTLTAPQLVEGKRAGLEELLRELLKELR